MRADRLRSRGLAQKGTNRRQYRPSDFGGRPYMQRVPHFYARGDNRHEDSFCYCGFCRCRCSDGEPGVRSGQTSSRTARRRAIEPQQPLPIRRARESAVSESGPRTLRARASVLIGGPRASARAVLALRAASPGLLGDADRLPWRLVPLHPRQHPADLRALSFTDIGCSRDAAFVESRGDVSQRRCAGRL
jgi:hypothetical protein